MNIFLKYTVRSLRKNKTRTLVTIIGIMLSMSLFTAVLTSAYSGLQFLINQETSLNGAWLGALNNVTIDKFEELENDKDIKDYTYLQEIGWARIETNYSPYLFIQSMPEDFTDLYPLIINGRLPENENEIILPSHLFITNFTYGIDDEITLQVGNRELQGIPMGIYDPYKENEEIVDATEKTYKIVGIYNQLIIESYMTPGYYALTRGSSNKNYTVFFTLKKPSKYYDFLSHQHYSRDYMNHSQLLRYNGVSKDKTITGTMYGFAGILCFLIAFGSISLVYNSFSISVSERIRQFGILQSIGATKKQIKQTVCFEAMILSIIAVPLGIVIGLLGIGMVFLMLNDNFQAFLHTNSSLKLVVSPGILLIATIISLVTTLISAMIPARKALRIAPIVAIRQNEEIKISPRAVKTPAFVMKLFGFEGMMALKNFKRNRKRYRATVLSLALSIILFISTSSFVSYLQTEAKTFVRINEGKDLLLRCTRGSEQDPDIDLMSQVIESTEGVDSYAYNMSVYETFYIPRTMMDTSYQQYFLSDSPSNPGTPIKVAYLKDEAFKQYAQEQNLDPNQFFDQDKPQGILVNTIQYLFESNNSSHYEHMSLLKNISLPSSIPMSRTKEIEGYTMLWEDNYGRYLFYPTDEAEEVYKGKEPDPNKTLAIPIDEACDIIPMNIGAFTQTYPLGMKDTDFFLLVYPASMMDANMPFKQDIAKYRQTLEYTIQSLDHVATRQRLSERMDSVGIRTSIYDEAANRETNRMILTIVNVFSYGFIILISLICIANVFNTISTSIALRKREFATLRSIGMSSKSFIRMMNQECTIYGLCSIVIGMPIAILITYTIYKVANMGMDTPFSIPPTSIVISIASVFLVVFITMLYATHRIQRENTIDALKDENI